MSNDIVIKVEKLSKQYRIGAKEGYKTFRETLVDAAKAPFVGLGGVLSKGLRARIKDAHLPLAREILGIFHGAPCYHCNAMISCGLSKIPHIK